MFKIKFVIFTLLFTLLFNKVIAKEYTVAVVGKTGVGKSYLINTLFNKTIAEVGDDEATTMDVTRYTTKVGEHTINVWDTMGMYDDVGDPKDYIKKIAEKVKETDILLFCFDSSEARFTKDNKEILKLFKNELDNKIYKNTLFVFTKYNVFRNKDSLINRKNKIRNIIPNARFSIGENQETNEWKNKLWADILEMANNDSKILLEVIYKRTKICDISKNETNKIILNNVYPNYMDKTKKETLKKCMTDINTFNNRIDSVAYVGSIVTYIKLAPLVINNIVTGGVSIGSGMAMKNVLNKFHRTGEYCEKILLDINTEHYQDTYNFENGKYIGYFKGNLFHGYGKIFDKNNYLLYKGEFNNGLPNIC